MPGLWLVAKLGICAHEVRVLLEDLATASRKQLSRVNQIAIRRAYLGSVTVPHSMDLFLSAYPATVLLLDCDAS